VRASSRWIIRHVHLPSVVDCPFSFVPSSAAPVVLPGSELPTLISCACSLAFSQSTLALFLRTGERGQSGQIAVEKICARLGLEIAACAKTTQPFIRATQIACGRSSRHRGAYQASKTQARFVEPGILISIHRCAQ
jgi:hypothetical protein